MSFVSTIENLPKLRVASIRSAFGEYIVKRQNDENLVKPFQCYKDDYCKQMISTLNPTAAYVIIDTYASDLKLFDIRGV